MSDPLIIIGIKEPFTETVRFLGCFLESKLSLSGEFRSYTKIVHVDHATFIPCASVTEA